MKKTNTAETQSTQYLQANSLHKTDSNLDKKNTAQKKEPFFRQNTEKRDIEKNYNRYYSTGIYKSRYPSINQQTLSTIHQVFSALRTKEKANAMPLQILDYGCGEGRYVCHLLSTYPNLHITAYDISSEPLQTLAKNLKNHGTESRVNIIYGETALAEYSVDQETTPFSIALLLFGVLSHIPSALQRLQVLSYLREAIDPIDGRLIVSVPNKARRFRKRQKELNSHEITYSRIIKQKEISFYYYLYDVTSIKKVLQTAGLDIVSIQAESVLPESWVTNYRIIGWLDQKICRLIPAKWGYGILVKCKVASS